MLRLLLSAVFLTVVSAASAETAYPTRPVTIIVPLAAGSGTDIMARELADGLSKRLNQTFVVDNRPGANGIPAMEFVARSANDGYTLVMGGNTTHSANPHLFKSLKYDPVRDFTPIARLVTASAVLVVSPKGEIRSMADLVKAAKTEKLSYGASNSGSQIAGERIKQMSQVDILRVPYRTLSQAVTDVIGGSITFTFVDVAAALANVRNGQLRALAQTASVRSSLMPDVPTLQESGYPGFDVTYWNGLFAPAGVPADVVATLSKAVNDVMTEKKVVDRVASLGLDPAYLPQAKMPDYVRDELAKWGKLIEQAGIEVN
ncbi:MAG: Bug family tripartite tricarboxylate transporter substrate binding protein [Pseudolabrys sp.]